MTKLGIVDLYADIPLEWYRLAQPRIIVSMTHSRDYWERVRQTCPSAFVLGRHYFETQPIHGTFWYEEIIDEAERMRGLYDAWMAINEPAIWNIADAEELRAETAIWSELMHKTGFKTAAYSFSEGHPDLSLWNYLGAHGCDYLALHEYDAPEMWRTQGWRCLRYRRIVKPLPRPPLGKGRDGRESSRLSLMPSELSLQARDDSRGVGSDVPVIIAETGIDGGVDGGNKPQRGWREFGDERHYLESLKWYDNELQKDSNVIGAAIFAWRWNIGGGSFDVKDCNAIRDHMAVASDTGGTHVSATIDDVDLARICLNVGFGDNAALAVAVILAESGGDPNAVNVNRAPGKKWDGSRDIGIWQFNSCWFRGRVTEWAMRDPVAATEAAYWASGFGKNFNMWSSYKAGSHKKFLPRAATAVRLAS